MESVISKLGEDLNYSFFFDQFGPDEAVLGSVADDLVSVYCDLRGKVRI